MFDGLRLRTGLAYSRFHFRRQKDGATRFSSALSRSRRALVILPERPVAAQDLSEILSYLSRRFSADAIVYVVREDLSTTLPPEISKQVSTYAFEDLTSFFTPRATLLRRLKSSTFDVAFDLNRDFFLPSAFLCKASSAAIRVSFTKDHADAFYNLQVRTHGSTSQNAYAHLLKCLDMF